MPVSRAIALAATLIVVPLQQAGAQFGGAPGMPGMPGGPGFGAPSAPPAVCQQLLTMRDDTQKHAQAIQRANERKATVQVACKLFRNFISAESKFVKGLVENSQTCGVPPEAIKQAKDGHVQSQKIAKQVCEAAAQPARPAGPSLSDALGASPYLPDGSSKQGGGTFDTLTGNALAR